MQKLPRPSTAARALAVSPGPGPRRRLRRLAALGTALLLPSALVLQSATATTANAAAAAVGSGFSVTAGDLSFILKQIKIAERHAATYTADNPCGTLVGPARNQVPDRLTAYGLRTVDGSCNNLYAGRETFGATDQPFPRLTRPTFRDAEASPPAFGPSRPTSYQQLKGLVFDTQPRLISNLIADQTAANPAARAAAAFPVRSQNNPGLHACTTDPQPDGTGGEPAGCVPSGQSLFIPNVTTDVGLSPPYNSMFTFFGQFFDHGIDQTVKGGGTVFVPLREDDPLVVGVDGVAGTADDPQVGDPRYVPPSQRFMVLTRAKNQPGPDGVLGTADDVRDANNTDSPWVDQSQTYASHASHQVFLREYAADATGRPAATGRLLGGEAPNETGMATWASLKRQSHDLLGIRLTDKDALSVPMLAVDPYGELVPGANGLPQFVTKTGLVPAHLDDPATPEDETVPVPANVVTFETPFLTDIAHNAEPLPGLVPDEDAVASTDFAAQPSGTYDDELLDAHFTAGDGRVNENIALTTIHQVFHSEHNRMVADVQRTLDAPANAGLKAAFEAVDPTAADPVNRTFGYGERLFQAARFVTEMEYQHLVFEEFGRKVQPLIRPFHVYTPDTNPAIQAEFAHAVYRFGHSMLNEEVARTDPDGADSSLSLLDAFLNPPAYYRGTNGTLTPEEAAGSIVMGSSDQVGNELDEFVTETLRNNLLGLPLDLATLNLTRAREAGVPPLNDFRRQIFARTNDGQLTPYTSWADLGQHLKHPESLVNFVAAYGTHPSITGAATLKAKRAAAKAIVDPSSGTPTDPADIPEDAADFLFGSGPRWSSDGNGVTTTGLEDVDLWIGGLAEVTNLGGGLLGSTFNYVFQNQMEELQDGDRLYYLARTPGMNLRTQLEGNSFSELIQRNTDGTNSLKADVFATADCKFQLGRLTFPAPAGSFLTGAGSVADDPLTTDCNENRLLLRKPDGTIAYRTINSVDPSGINGQVVYNGTPGVDRVYGGNDNDTFWGGQGNDVINGGGGDDVALGGEGNDRITDLSGADVLKGGPGHDALDAGIGDDLIMGGDGQDFTNGGANDNETFAGPGDDFVIAGQGADAVFGDGGDDWIEGGSGQDLLIGDHGAPFFDDPADPRPGHDVLIGQVGENDYDAEGGDDIMSQNAAVDRNAGAGGYDWAIHQYDTVGADDDMEINNFLAGVPIQVVVNRDRWQETEANSGSAFDDVIRGTNDVPSTVGGAGFTGCDVLDQAGVDRISGLGALLPPLTGDLAPVEAASAAGVCPLTGPLWGGGNILLGGAGSDRITGRGGDDVIDGDKSLRVRISVRTDPADPTTEIGSTDLMEKPYLAGSSKTLQQAVFDGTVDPGQLVTVREIVDSSAADKATSVDTAVFARPRADYTITVEGDHLVVTQTTNAVAPQKVSDGSDTLRNIERLQFSDQTLSVTAPAAPVIGTATAGDAEATVTWSPPAGGSATVLGYDLVVSSGGVPVRTVPSISRLGVRWTVRGLTNGTPYTFAVRAFNSYGDSPLSAASNEVTPQAAPAPPPTDPTTPTDPTGPTTPTDPTGPTGPTTPGQTVAEPGAPTGVAAVRGNARATVSWTRGGTGGSALTGHRVQVLAGTAVVRTVTVGNVTSAVVTGLTNGRTYSVRVQAVNAVGVSPWSASRSVTPATTPSAPRGLRVARGAAGGALTVSARWTAPASNGGSTVTAYRVSAQRYAANGTAVGAPRVTQVGAGARSAGIRLPAGSYRLTVRAVNAVGQGTASPRSPLVSPR
ncbi:MAG: peroxidase family protein [Nocardioidaceae bacterium]